MLQIVRLAGAEPANWPEEALSVLRAAPTRYHSNPEDPSFGALASLGLPCEPLPSQVDRDAALVVVRSGSNLSRLVATIDRLLGPGGCPWDQEQTHETLKRHLLEEAYEVLDAIDTGWPDKLKEELGDLLMQPIMHAQMEKLQGGFDVEDVAGTIVEKLIRRHPHVFGDHEVANADEVLRNWDRIKQNEKGGEPESLLAGVPKGMASLLRAYEISKRAARVGFEWPTMEAVFAKLREEEGEFREALESGDAVHSEAELGDLLFTVVNLARWAKIEPEEALRKMLNRFTTRFQEMERASDRALVDLSPDEWDELWERSKAMHLPAT